MGRWTRRHALQAAMASAGATLWPVGGAFAQETGDASSRRSGERGYGSMVVAATHQARCVVLQLCHARLTGEVRGVSCTHPSRSQATASSYEVNALSGICS